MTPMYLPPNSNAANDYSMIQQGRRNMASSAPSVNSLSTQAPSVGDMGMMPSMPPVNTGANVSLPDPFTQSGGMNTSPEQNPQTILFKITQGLKRLTVNSQRISAANKSINWSELNPKRIRW